ncbi:hypothetical protein Z043_120869, partial [Scleropages formosus]
LGILVTLTFSVSATAVLSDLWCKEWTTLLLSLQVTAPYLHVGGVSLMTLLSWPIALHFFRMNKRVRQVAIVGLYLAVLFALYLVPLGMYSPCIKEEDTLGPPPTLIGHRGAPMRDPFGTASSLDPADQARAQNQSIPTLRSFLDLAAHYNKLVIFDLRRPPEGHPYRDSWLNRTLEVVLNESSINSSQVLWLPSEARSLVQVLEPHLQQTSGYHGSVEQLQEQHIVRLNLHYSFMSQEQISKYASVNISTNLYVISQPWLYSLAWCAGAQSVTTNALHILKVLRRPLFFMTPEEYNLMWILTDVVSAVLVLAVFLFHWWRESGLTFWSDSRQTQENGPYSKFRTELSDVWSVSSMSVRGVFRSTPATPHLPTVS